MKAAEEIAYREYVVARMEQLRRTAYLLCHDWHTADDVVATALGKLYRQWHRAQQAGSLDGYVRKMMLHVYLDERRRPWRREHATGEVPDVAAPVQPVGDESGVLAQLRALPPRRRAVLVLRFYCDMSVEETAEILGISSGTVKSQTARGLEALRTAMTVEPGAKR